MPALGYREELWHFGMGGMSDLFSFRLIGPATLDMNVMHQFLLNSSFVISFFTSLERHQSTNCKVLQPSDKAALANEVTMSKNIKQNEKLT